VFDHQYGFPVRSRKPSVRTAVFPLFFHLLHALERVFVRFSRHPEQAPPPYGRRLRRCFAEWYALRGIRDA
ncbi:MAG: hypothetical protein ACXWIH_16910, partial [Burkholderiales bacterium]